MEQFFVFSLKNFSFSAYIVIYIDPGKLFIAFFVKFVDLKFIEDVLFVQKITASGQQYSH